jgi:Domain of unknown function (DUF4234)
MATTPPPPPPTPTGAPAPTGVPGDIRSPGTVIILSIITCGIYAIWWEYKTFNEMKQYSGEGVGGTVGLLLAIFIGVVNLFLIPSEIGGLYERAGQEKPFSPLVGLWNLIPLIGFIVWVMKVQGALNEFWEARGAVKAA